MSTRIAETAQLRCPQCSAVVTSESALCSACGAALVGVPLSPSTEDAATLPQRPAITQPLPQEQPPTPAQPAPGIPASGVVINNYAGKPPKPKERRAFPLWMVAFPALGVVLILGLLLILLAPKGSHLVAAAPTPTAKPSPTTTPIPQARVVIQLVDVMCSVTRDFFSADSFYIKSNLSAPGLTGEDSAWTETTDHYTINNGQSASFNQADQTIFDATVPLSGIVKGSLTAYTDDDSHQLSTTDIKVSASESSQVHTWAINGMSGKFIINTWSYTVHYSTSITRLAASRGMGSASVGSSWLQIADTPAFQGRTA
jgi:hypothetical protein